MSVNGVLLDTSVVVRHFRTPGGISGKLDSFEAIYLPQPTLAELRRSLSLFIAREKSRDYLPIS